MSNQPNKTAKTLCCVRECNNDANNVFDEMPFCAEHYDIASTYERVVKAFCDTPEDKLLSSNGSLTVSIPYHLMDDPRVVAKLMSMAPERARRAAHQMKNEIRNAPVKAQSAVQEVQMKNDSPKSMFAEPTPAAPPAPPAPPAPSAALPISDYVSAPTPYATTSVHPMFSQLTSMPETSTVMTRALDKIKRSASDATVRVAAVQFRETVKGPMLALIKRNVAPRNKTMHRQINEWAETDFGKACMDAILSLGLEALPMSVHVKYPFVVTLAAELRTSAMTNVANPLVSLLLGPVQQMAASFFDENAEPETLYGPAKILTEAAQKVSAHIEVKDTSKVTS